MLKSLVFAAIAATASAACATDNWCNFGELDIYYNCNATALESCLSSKLAPKGERTKVITLTYDLPAYKDTPTSKLTEFSVASTVPGGASADVDKAFFTVNAALKVIGGADIVAYLGVMQAVTFKAFNSSSLTLPKIPDVGELEVCWAKSVDGKCAVKNFEANMFKYSFALYQMTDCGAECYFYLRSTVDYSKLDPATAVYFNGDKAVTPAAVTVGETLTIKSMTVGDMTYDFPSGVNVNNTEWLETGCTVHVEEKPADNKLKLMYKVKAPGAKKFLMYDPTVKTTVATVVTPTAAAAAGTGGTATATGTAAATPTAVTPTAAISGSASNVPSVVMLLLPVLAFFL